MTTVQTKQDSGAKLAGYLAALSDVRAYLTERQQTFTPADGEYGELLRALRHVRALERGAAK